VILEEIAMYLDDPGHRVYERLMEVHFGNHPLSMSVLGSAESIKKLERDQMADYFNGAMARATWCCRPPGNLDFDEIVNWRKNIAANWPHVDAPRNQPEPFYTIAESI
jgi:predicted Zn-dependent peptidase